MRSADKGFWLLVVVAGCWLLSLALPAYEKLWFVAPSGNYGGSPWGSLILLFLLFRRWRPARLLMLVLCGLSVCLVSCVLCYNFTHSGPLLGWCLVLPLELVVVAILSYSMAVKQFLASKPSNTSNLTVG